MKHKKVIMILITLIYIFSMAASAMAASEIKNVKLKISLSEFDELNLPVLEAEAKSSCYEASDINLFLKEDERATGPAATGSEARLEGASKEDFQESEDFICEVELYADSGYYFGTMEQKNIKLSGIKGECRKAVRKDQGSTLVLTIYLTGLSDKIGKIEELHLSQKGTASWNQAGNAAVYATALYRDSKKVGSIHKTSGCSFDFSPLMREAGEYYFKVYPLTASGKKGKAVKSGTISVNKVTADVNALSYLGDGGWQETGERCRYQAQDGTYVQNNWIQMDDSWYFFGDNGEMVKDTWKKWKNKWYFLDETGKMIQDRVIADGYFVDTEGALVKRRK